jgi:4-hydroxy-tetrahydrodipicolinate synthase
MLAMTGSHAGNPRRREFLRSLSAGALGLALSRRTPAADTPGAKQMRGVFPIGLTPFTPDDKLDLEGLAAEVKFCNRGGVHGFIWPQIASGWSTLTEQERMDGAEAILAAGRGGKTVLIIGVQGPDLAAVARYAKHAEKLGADGIVSLPPAGASDDKSLVEYYQQVGRLSPLPLFVQSVGSVSVDAIVEMFNTIPTMRQVKDEAGDPLQRVTELRRRTNDQLKVFSGNGVRTMITEMELGFSGHCPFPTLADVYAAAFDLWHAGKKVEALDMFGRILALGTMGPVTGHDVLIARGVFKPGTRGRSGAPVAAGSDLPAGGRGGAGGRGARGGGRPWGVKEIRDALDTYMKPYLRA